MNKKLLRCSLFVILGAGACLGLLAWWNAFYITVERTDVSPSPKPEDDLGLVDDRLEDKQTVFDPELVDRREYEGWQINLSEAVIRLNCPDIREDSEPYLLTLHASYRDVIQAASEQGLNLLPSANMLDGFAKQFDDGLYAAMDLACFRGESAFSPSAVSFVASTFDALPTDSRARPFLGAALQLAEHPVELTQDEQDIADEWIVRFESDPSRSTPISFYTWNDELRKVWKFFRFLQHRFNQSDLKVPLEIAATIDSNEPLRTEYTQLIQLYSGMTNPPDSLNLNQLKGVKPNLSKLARSAGRQRPSVSLLPPSTSRETELFNRLFSDGTMAQSNLMMELIRRVRSGTVDLTPRDNSGWYAHQLYALETMVLPERGQESEKLLLTVKYKRRLLQAFQALITKRRETHARQLGATDSAMAQPPKDIQPRLRVEPCATFYLRTARSYAFLENFLQATLESNVLSMLHGQRADGPRELDLQTELASIKQLFYGFHLLACEDIGMASNLTEEENVDADAAYAAAEQWLSNLQHPDLGVDTRVSVPIANDPQTNTSRVWATIGVRLSKLDASYARGPKMRENDEADWQPVDDYRLADSHYVIAVDEFAELSLPGGGVMTRQRLRDLCDQHKTKTEILKAFTN